MNHETKPSPSNHTLGLWKLPLRARLWNFFQDVVGTNKTKIRAIEPHTSDAESVLEIGCATGNLADCFRESDYVGVDTNEKSIRFASRRFSQPNYRFHCLDIVEGSLPSEERFDVVLISHTAHHIPDPYFERLILRSSELLKPKGKLVVLDMIRPEPDESFRKQFYYKLDRGRFFRNVPEFREIFRREGSFPDVTHHVVKTMKWGIEMIDQVVIVAERSAGNTSPDS